ncbi:MAG TPA: gliding motility-associated C-terminal domain-containing protein [Flavobacteriales bacterium]
MEKLNLYIRTLLIVVAVPFASRAQNGDCSTAISVCNSIYQETNSPVGTGNVYEVAPGSCQTGGEFNSAWYIFTAQEDGPLSFILQPNNNNDDYDWSLFDITDNGCAGINSGASPELSCNSYGILFGVPGPTGISTAMGGSGSSNGPGDFNGPPFNEDVNVSAGRVYALVVMNWSGSTNGYTLDFSVSNTSIYDNTPPQLVSSFVKWCTGEIELHFNEDVDITGLIPGNFIISPGNATVTAISMPNNATHGHTLKLQVSNLNSVNGNALTLTLQNQILGDLCGNPFEFPVQISMVPEFNFTTAIEPACNGFNGSLSVSVTPSAAYEFTVNNQGIVSFPLNNLMPGNLELTITDEVGCTKTAQLTMPNQIATLTLPEDTVLCSMSMVLHAQFEAQQFHWVTQTGLTFQNPQSTTTQVIAASPIQYTIEAVAQTGTCSVSDVVHVTFNLPPVVEIDIDDVQCYGQCNGRIQVTNAEPSNISIWTNEHSIETGNAPILSSVCAGSYELFISFGAQCMFSEMVQVGQPAPVKASIENSYTTVDIREPEITLISNSLNAASVIWMFEGTTTVLSQQTVAQITLPQVPGTYVLLLYAYDSNGCVDVLRIPIEVVSELLVYAPNAFTPNNDNMNDVFRIYLLDEPKEYELTIYNRYGQAIFTAYDPKQVWTGNMHEGDYYTLDGLYQWVLKLKAKGDNEAKVYRGYVNLLR